jgi:hypothetical protein
MRRNFVWTLTLYIAAFLAIFGSINRTARAAPRPDATSDVVLPSDVHVLPPGSDVPPGLAAFSGKWGPNRWDGDQLSHILIVEEIKPTGDAVVLYAWGNWARWRIKAGSVRVHGVILDGILSLDRFKNGARAQYKLDLDGSLVGTYTLGSSHTTGKDTYVISLARAVSP